MPFLDSKQARWLFKLTLTLFLFWLLFFAPSVGNGEEDKRREVGRKPTAEDR